ncbi:2'-5' RNA ligase family protein [Chitinophaga solisilvae]|uniref:2'-5' RNA ligase family protein n=1 Tax=Chitinophaga solisilvae TaxID=1233460 RepID=UPI001367C528|nr:2'-5' RNA ligase family protein [Chitinophaga solisilvae]
MTQPKPMIVTLEIAADDMLFFQQLRDAHFPAHANYLDAHITLFHRLPGGEPAITDTLAKLAARPPLSLQVNGIVKFTNGIAYTLFSPDLQALHEELQTAFMPWLVRQDKQPLRPHITIQNKVTAFKAAQLHSTLLASFTPFAIQATGFGTWSYLRGPWKALQKINFNKR